MKLLTTDLEEISFVQHGFFTRLGGVSTGLYASLNCGLKTDDKQTNVRTNRTRAAEALDIAPDRLVIAKQVHGNKALTVTTPWAIDQAPEGDAIVTDQKGIGLGILTADCAPILFVDKKARIIGAAHAGWRGALGGVVESTVEAMKALGAQLEHIQAAIGPCIGFNSYEVKDDFKPQFVTQNPAAEKFFKVSPRKGHLLFNLPGYVAMRLNGAGVATVFDIRQDTVTNDAVFFSNRRAFLKSEKGFGLQISIISIK